LSNGNIQETNSFLVTQTSYDKLPDFTFQLVRESNWASLIA